MFYILCNLFFHVSQLVEFFWNFKISFGVIFFFIFFILIDRLKMFYYNCIIVDNRWRYCHYIIFFVVKRETTLIVELKTNYKHLNTIYNRWICINHKDSHKLFKISNGTLTGNGKDMHSREIRVRWLTQTLTEEHAYF